LGLLHSDCDHNTACDTYVSWSTEIFFEPWQVARQLRKKYATALWISCKELQIHLQQIQDKVAAKDTNAINALKKIPDKDFNKRPDWFTKHGYYATITAYKIAVVSSWLCIYQQELLFSTYSKSRGFISGLYQKVDGLKRAFSEDTFLWYDYFDAIGSKLVDRPTILQPLSFGGFCDRYFSDYQFRQFYDQLHRFISVVTDEKYLPTMEKIKHALDELMSFLEKENLLAGFHMKRPTINPDLSEQPNP
jgi:hypothetical protein